MQRHGNPLATSLALALLALVPVVRLLVDLRRGFDHLMYARLCDDAFYYFVISRHIPFFNDGIATTGFHPLYAVLVAPFHRWLPPETAVIASVSLLVLAYSAGTFLVHALARRHFGPWAAMAAAGAWACSGRLYGLVTTGVETILAVVAVLGVLQLALPSRTMPTRRRVVAVGLLAGLAFLARMDAPLLLAPTLVLFVASLVRRRRYADGVIAVLLPAAACLAWVAAMVAITGDAAPTSGSALRAQRGVDGILADPRIAQGATWHLARQAAAFLVAVPGKWPRAFVLITACLLATSSVVVLRRRRPEAGRLIAIQGAVLAAGVLLWAAYYVLILGGFRLWYYAYLAIPFYGFVVPVVVEAVSELRGDRTAPVTGAVIVAMIAMFAPARPFAHEGIDKLRSSRALNAHLAELPAGARIGSFNTGIYDYFSDADIRNLDGVVNPGALRALRAHDLPRYLQEESISYVLEGEGDAMFHTLRADSRVRLEKVLDLRKDYAPYRGRYSQDTFLWHIEIVPERNRPRRLRR